MVRHLTADGTQHLPAHMPEKFKKLAIASFPRLDRQSTLTDFEMIDLAPKVEGRIRKLDSQVHAYTIQNLGTTLFPFFDFMIFNCLELDYFKSDTSDYEGVKLMLCLVTLYASLSVEILARRYNLFCMFSPNLHSLLNSLVRLQRHKD